MGINLKEINDNSNTNTEFKALPDDRYTLVIDSATLGTAKNGTTEMIKVAFTVTDGKFKNRKLWTNFTLTQKSYVFILGLLKAIKSPLVEAADVEYDEICKALVKGKCTAWVETSAGFNGKPQNNLSKFAAIEGAPASTGTTPSVPSATKANLFG